MSKNTYTALGACAALSAGIAVSGLTDVFAQQAVQDRPVQTSDQAGIAEETAAAPKTADHAKHKQACKASEIIGMNVRGRSGDENIGSINDLMIHKDGRVSYAAVSFGGFLGVGDKLFAVPFEAIEFVKADDGALYARIDVTEESLKRMEGFDQQNWPERANTSFLGQGVRQVERPATGTEVPQRQ